LSTRLLTVITILVTYILIVFGGFVASTQSGMGCGPDWPLCNGALIPSLQGTTLIEFTHRVIGAILVILSLILLIQVLRSSDKGADTRTAGLWMMGILILQVLFGAVVVIYDLPAIVVTIHLLTAMAYLASLIWLWQRFNLEALNIHHSTFKTNTKRKTIKTHLNVSLGLVLLTFTFGAYIKHQNYGLACDWFVCGDSLFTMNNPQLLHTIHRILAVTTAAYILLLTYWAFIKDWGKKIQKRLILAAAIVLVQVVIGILTIMTNIDLWLAVLHLAVGTALFAIIMEARLFLNITSTRKRINRGKIY
jgi:cytochrome c oxidase assembly protein subunit 15